MTSWLRGSPLRTSLGRRGAPSPPQDVDPAAAFHSFIKHWQQTRDIIARTQARQHVGADDVTAVINHLAQMVTLLLVDLRQILAHSSRTHNGVKRKAKAPQNPVDALKENGSQHASLPAENPPNTPIFDHFLGEEILDTVLTWSLTTGEYVNALKLEQLRVHEQLLSHSRQEILVYKPIIRPLLRLLNSCGGCVPVEVEKRLVVLLNQLCVSLMHNHHLLDFFFQFSNDQGPTKFMIFSLLLPFVHREGGIGQQARDALLLCMALSASHDQVGQYVARHSNFCPVLAAGLSGLYSMLPRSLSIEAEGWHRLSQYDVTDIPQLQLFLNSLEFCNAVVQVAHPLVREQLVEFLYQGFLVPVLGPALHQNGAVNGDVTTHNTPVFLSVVDEVVAATAYVELCLRTVTEPELRRAFLATLFTSPNNPAIEPPIVTILISRLHSPNTQLCLVTLSLFLTLVELSCEDVMVSLVFQYLTPCGHVMLSQRSRLTQPPCPPAQTHRFLQLIPAVCQLERDEALKKKTEESLLLQQTQISSMQQQHTSSLHPTQPSSLSVPHHQRSLSNTSSCSSDSDSPFVDNQTAYSDYLLEARSRVEVGVAACSCWTWRYDGLHPTPNQAVEMLDAARTNPPVLYAKPRAHSEPLPPHENLPRAEAKVRSESSPSRPNGVNGETQEENSGKQGENGETQAVVNGVCDTLEMAPKPPQPPGARGEENLDSLGESSGYESFNIRASRDSSPSHSSQGSPRSRILNQEPVGPSDDSEQREPDSKDDQEFLETLQRSTTPTEMTGVEEAMCEIEQAFTTFKISDFSSSQTHNKVYRIELGEDGEWDVNLWQNPDTQDVPEKTPVTEPSPSRPTIGPFLEALMLRVDQMLTSSIHVNLLVTAVISCLASYPTPLLASLLLDATIVFQPSVRSLVQVVSGLKGRIDGLLTPEDVSLVVEARHWFAIRLVVPKYAPSRTRTPSTSSSPDTSLVRGEGKRRSFSQTMNALFRRSAGVEQPAIKESPLEILDDRSGCRYVKRASVSTLDGSAGGPGSQKRHAARCAVLVREWLLELSALAQEQTVRVPCVEFTFPST